MLVPMEPSRAVAQVPMCAPKMIGIVCSTLVSTPAVTSAKAMPIVAPLLWMMDVSAVASRMPRIKPLGVSPLIEAMTGLSNSRCGLMASLIRFMPRNSKPKPMKDRPIFLCLGFFATMLTMKPVATAKRA